MWGSSIGGRECAVTVHGFTWASFTVEGKKIGAKQTSPEALTIIILLAPTVKKVYSDIQRINLYPVHSAIINFPNTYPLDSDSSGGWRYPAFEQLRPGDFCRHSIKTWISWPNVFNFESTSIFAICCNRQRETIAMPKYSPK